MKELIEMDKIIKKKPILLSGLALGLAALGNLMGQYGSFVRYFFGLLAAIAFLCVTIFIVRHTHVFTTEIANPVIASIFGTYSMAGMILSTYLLPMSSTIAYALWILFIIMHMVLILFFTIKYALKHDIITVFPSWFIIYVGIVVASVTGPNYEAFTIGRLSFWFGLVAYVILLPIVLYRLIKVRKISNELLPNIAINSAPASLLLAGYVNSFIQYNRFILYSLLIIFQFIFVLTILVLPKLMNVPFSLSFAAFTFPFVITALSLMFTLNMLNINTGVLHGILVAETWLAVMIVSYVTVASIRFYVH